MTIPEFSRPKLKQRRRPHFTREEVELLISHCSPALADAVTVAAYTGLRQDELLSLTADDIRPPQPRIHVL